MLSLFIVKQLTLVSKENRNTFDHAIPQNARTKLDIPKALNQPNWVTYHLREGRKYFYFGLSPPQYSIQIKQREGNTSRENVCKFNQRRNRLPGRLIFLRGYRLFSRRTIGHKPLTEPLFSPETINFPIAPYLLARYYAPTVTY